MNEVLTGQEVASLLQLHLKTIYKLAEKGTLPGVRIGRSWRFKKADIDKCFNPAPAAPAVDPEEF